MLEIILTFISIYIVFTSNGTTERLIVAGIFAIAAGLYSIAYSITNKKN